MRAHGKPPAPPARGLGVARQRGFTLVELIVVVAIIAMIALFSIPNLQRFRVKSKGTNALIAVARPFDLARAEATKRHSPIGVFADFTVGPPAVTVWEDWDPDNQTGVPFDSTNNNGLLDLNELTIETRSLSTYLTKLSSAPPGDPGPLTAVSTVRYKSDGGLQAGSGAIYLGDPTGNVFRVRIVPTSGTAKIEGWLPDTKTWSARKEDWEWKF